MKLLIRKNFSGRERLSMSNYPPSITQQSQANETDINKIMSKFARTGLLPQSSQDRIASFGDFTNINNYQAALNCVIKARDEFETLPAKIRAEFHNDPEELITFLNNPENKDKAIELGLIEPDAKPIIPDSLPKDKTVSPTETPTEPVIPSPPAA